MRERWHENILKLRLVDERGEVRGAKWPSVRELKRAGMSHPFRFYAQVGFWPNAVVQISIYGASLVLFLVLEAVLFSAFGFALFPEPYNGPFNEAVSIALPLLWFVVTICAAVKVYNMRSTTKYVCTLLKYGKCPWCLYDLSGSVADEDGLTTCPECGGVWQIDDVPACGG